MNGSSISYLNNFRVISAKTQKIDALADCLEQSQMNDLLQKEGRRPAPDPVPPGDEVGGSVVPGCDERTATGAGGYWGTKKNSVDECLIGDFCDFAGPMHIAGRFPDKRCQYVEKDTDAGLGCQSVSTG